MDPIAIFEAECVGIVESADEIGGDSERFGNVTVSVLWAGD